MTMIDDKVLLERARATLMSAKVIADSQLGDNRLTTFELCYPRFFHSELMTHRTFGRNASSSRAIPVKKMIADIEANTAMPLFWGLNQSGMQADVEADAEKLDAAKAVWLYASKSAIRHAETLNELGMHKQIVNRILEPFMFIRVIVTATEYDNFFNLRAHKDAQPEFKALALLMKEAMDASTPIKTLAHLPYITYEEVEGYVKRNALDDIEIANKALQSVFKGLDTIETSSELESADVADWCLQLFLAFAPISTARSARVSYLTHDGKAPSVEADIQLFKRLVGSDPIHASPSEHPAYAGDEGAKVRHLTGWVPYRALLEDLGVETLLVNEIIGGLV